METSQLIKTIQKNKDIPLNRRLNNIFKKMYEYDAEEFFYYEYPLNLKSKEIEKLVDELDKIIFDEIGYEIYINNINHLSTIKTALNYLLKGIKENNLVSFLIFFQSNIFLRLDINKIIEFYDLNKEFRLLLTNINDFLKNLKIFTMEMESYNNSEEFIKQIKRDLAIKENEKLNSSLKLLDLNTIQYISKTPNLIFSQLTLEITSFFKNNAFNIFEKTLLELDNLLSITLFVKVCSFEEIIKIYNNNENKLYGNLIFLFVKKFLDKEYNEVSEYKTEVKNILKKLYLNNHKYFIEILKQYDTNELLNASIGLFICELNENEIKKLIDEFPIQWHVEQKKDKKIFLEHCDKENTSFNTVLDMTYKKWENYLNQLYKSNNYLLLKEFLTNFSDFILYKYVKETDEKVINEIINILNKIKYLSSEWACNLNNYKNRFYIHYSRLYILSFAYEYKKLDNEEIKSLFDEIFKNTYVKELFNNNDYENSINILKENIFYDKK